MAERLTFVDSPASAQFSVDAETRTIKGLAVPFGDVATSDGMQWTFTKGSLTWGKVRLLNGHDWNQVLGLADLAETDEGLVMTAKVAKGARGDEVLALAEMGAIDGLSIGLGADVKATAKDGVQHVRSAVVREVSTTPIPAFERAAIRSVAASAAPNRGEKMDDETKVEETETETGPDFSAITEAITKGFEGLTSGERPAVVPAGAPTFEVDEASPYRFDGVEGEHDFSSDLIAYGRDRDSEAGERVMAFMAEQFAPTFDVQTGNVTPLNPARQRPDMYVDERRFTTPLYDALYKGAISDNTPFIVPKFSSASNLVDDHVEGVEPDEGNFEATSQTITPSAVSGKVPITREVWDQGGNPQVSGLIWRKMVEHYYAALEAKAFALLNGTTVPAAQVHTITTGAADDELVNEVEDVIIDLNFIAGGNTFDYAGTHANLYKALANAVDASGRKLLPQYGPTNANGQSRSKFKSLDVAGTEFMPVPSLGAKSTDTGKSYLLDTSAVHVWNSAPQRLQFEYRVAYVDLGIWGYVASAITDLAGVQRLDYDPAV